VRETNPASAPNKSSAEVGAVHPDQLFLLADVVAHEGVGPFIAGLTREVEQRAFAQQDHAEGGHTVLEGLDPVGDILDHGNLADSEVLFVGVGRMATEGQDALSDLINLELQVRVELLELGVELEKRLTADVPMETARVHVEDREVGQEVVEAGGELGGRFGVQSDGCRRVHIESTWGSGRMF